MPLRDDLSRQTNLLAQVHRTKIGVGETSPERLRWRADPELVLPLLGKTHGSSSITDSLPAAVRTASAGRDLCRLRNRYSAQDLPGNPGQPLLAAGRCQPYIRAYNTCAGYNYNTRTVARRQISGQDKPEGPYDDQIAFTHRAGELAESLLAEGYTAMKIWPFDPLAERAGGSFLSREDRELGLGPWRKIREAVGDRIEVMSEFHSLWNLQQAKQIARALEEYRPYWAEDPIKMCDVATLKDYAQSTSIPVCGSETLGGTAPFRDLLQAQAAAHLLDAGWWRAASTQDRRVADLPAPGRAARLQLPVVWVASIHLMHIPNALIMEAVRVLFDLVEHPSPSRGEGGHIYLTARWERDCS